MKEAISMQTKDTKEYQKLLHTHTFNNLQEMHHLLKIQTTATNHVNITANEIDSKL